MIEKYFCYKKIVLNLTHIKLDVLRNLIDFGF